MLKVHRLLKEKQIILCSILSERGLTFGGECDTIYKLSRRDTHSERYHFLKRFFQKSLKNPLTKSKESDTIYKLFERQQSREAVEKSFLKNFKKPLDKSAEM